MKVSPVSLVLCIGLTFFQYHSLSAATFNIADGDVAGLKAAMNTSNTNQEDDTINLANGGTYILTTIDNSTYGPTGLPVLVNDRNIKVGGNYSLTINGNGETITRRTVKG